MAFYKEDIVDINLNTGNIFRSFLGHSIGYKDDDADRFGIRAFRDGVPVDLSGASCQAIFMNPNGTNIALTSYGTVSGNVAYVTLPPACYDYEGQFCLAIKLVGGGVTGTVRIVDGTVTRTGASGTVSPTSAVPTYQEILSTYDAMVAATSAANLAIAETFNATKAYPAGKYVINEGHLYRLTADHAANVTWANTSKVSTNFGDDLSSLKSALNLEKQTRENNDSILNSSKIPFPVSPESKYGTRGQNLRTLGNGRTQWTDIGLPTDEQTAEAVSAWLDAHPEATTTVQDGSLTEAKFNDSIYAGMPIQIKGNILNSQQLEIPSGSKCGGVCFGETENVLFVATRTDDTTDLRINKYQYTNGSWVLLNSTDFTAQLVNSHMNDLTYYNGYIWISMVGDGYNYIAVIDASNMTFKRKLFIDDVITGITVSKFSETRDIIALSREQGQITHILMRNNTNIFATVLTYTPAYVSSKSFSQCLFLSTSALYRMSSDDSGDCYITSENYTNGAILCSMHVKLDGEGEGFVKKQGGNILVVDSGGKIYEVDNTFPSTVYRVYRGLLNTCKFSPQYMCCSYIYDEIHDYSYLKYIPPISGCCDPTTHLQLAVPMKYIEGTERNIPLLFRMWRRSDYNCANFSGIAYWSNNDGFRWVRYDAPNAELYIGIHLSAYSDDDGYFFLRVNQIRMVDNGTVKYWSWDNSKTMAQNAAALQTAIPYFAGCMFTIEPYGYRNIGFSVSALTDGSIVYPECP